jgi:hypothetical protein
LILPSRRLLRRVKADDDRRSCADPLDHKASDVQMPPAGINTMTT